MRNMFWDHDEITTAVLTHDALATLSCRQLHISLEDHVVLITLVNVTTPDRTCTRDQNVEAKPPNSKIVGLPTYISYHRRYCHSPMARRRIAELIFWRKGNLHSGGS